MKKFIAKLIDDAVTLEVDAQRYFYEKTDLIESSKPHLDTWKSKADAANDARAKLVKAVDALVDGEVPLSDEDLGKAVRAYFKADPDNRLAFGRRGEYLETYDPCTFADLVSGLLE